MTSVRCYRTTVEDRMVTDNNNVPEVESSGEPTGVEQVSSETEPSVETPSVEETVASPPQAQPTETVNVEGTTETGETRSYSQSEFAKLQSANDRRIAETEKQNKMLQDQIAYARQEADSNNLSQQVEVYKEQQRQRYIAQGIDDQTAMQIANEQTEFARKAYLTEKANERTMQQLQQSSRENEKRTQQARAYELATQNGINFSELDGIVDPVAMEKVAKALGKAQKLEQRIQGSVGSSTYGSSQPSADVAPTDAESVLDKYNSGDPGITTEQAQNAAKKLGMPDLI